MHALFGQSHLPPLKLHEAVWETQFNGVLLKTIKSGDLFPIQ